MIQFTVVGVPVGKERARTVRNNDGSGVRTFTPAKTKAYETQVRFLAQRAMAGRHPFAGPVSLMVEIGLPVPARWSSKRRELAYAGHILPTGKPDADNVLKAILDGMNGIFYKDDSQVVYCQLVKLYAPVPGVTVRGNEVVGESSPAGE